MEVITERLDSLLKEEAFGRMGAASLGISRFKVLEEFFNKVIGDGKAKDVYTICVEHLAENPDSVTSAYLAGVISFHTNIIDGKAYLIELLKRFQSLSKWAVVEHIAEKILEYGENSTALKLLAEALEKLKRKKEAIPVWEELIKINRYDADIAKKLSLSVAEEDMSKSTQYLKLALEGYAKNANYEGVASVWPMLVERAWDDFVFFERIDRLLVDGQRKDIAQAISTALYEKYKDDDPETAVTLAKKVLKHNPKDVEMRKKLIKAYQHIYKEHSQLSRFLELSKLGDYNTPIEGAVSSFETNIIFDTGHYVYHRTWGLGQISSMDSESVFINFKDKPEHRMSINMALQSLEALNPDHLYVKQHLDPDAMHELFKKDFIAFFRILIKSYGNSVTQAQIKHDLIPEYVEQKSWSRWWTKARTAIKKDPDLGFAPNKKDQIILREVPMSFAEELVRKFHAENSFSGKLDLAEDFVTTVSKDEGKEYVGPFAEYFSAAVKEDSETKLILSYFVMRDLTEYAEDKVAGDLDQLKNKVVKYIKESDDLPLLSRKIASYDNKKEFINLIKENRSDWLEVAESVLYETPVRIHKYIFNLMLIETAYDRINRFIERIITGAKEYPEILLWIGKNIFLKTWTYTWLDYPYSKLVLSFLRAYREVDKTETKGNRLKNLAYEILFADENKVLKEIIAESDLTLLSRAYALAGTISHIDESELDTFKRLITVKYPDFKGESGGKAEEGSFDDEEILVTPKGLEQKQKELSVMINSDMVKLQKDLASSADLSGDMRENVDYTALLDKQTILKQSISKLDQELKVAKVIEFENVSTEKVETGTTVELSDDEGTKMKISILGPWDADFEKNILSYRSEVGKKLIGRSVGDEAMLHFGGEEKNYKIEAIHIFDEVGVV